VDRDLDEDETGEEYGEEDEDEGGRLAVLKGVDGSPHSHAFKKRRNQENPSRSGGFESWSI
jgi:hypothetical protein